jgi:hypothetical protein
VTEISERLESTVGLLAGRPKQMRSFNSEPASNQVRGFASDAGTSLVVDHRPTEAYGKIEETDFLFVDNEHTYERTKLHLENLAPSVRRFIAFHDTDYYGGFGTTRGKNGDQGLMPAIGEYLSTHREWSVIYQSHDEYGLTVIGRLDVDKPKLPPVTDEAKNLASAIWKVAKDYVKGNELQVEAKEYEARLAVCTTCDQRVNDRCASCGCFINEKAKIASFPDEVKVFCPLVRWPFPEQFGRSKK